MLNTVTVIVNSFGEKEVVFREAMQSILNAMPSQVILSTVVGDECIGWISDSRIDVVISDEPSVYGQLNKAVPLVRMPYTCYASSNDIMCPHKLRDEVAILKEKDMGVCYSSFDKLYPDTGGKTVHISRGYSYSKHLRGSIVSDCAMVKTDILRKYYPFKEEYGNKAFYDFWLRVYEGEGDVFINNRNPTWCYVIHNDSSHIQRSKGSAAWNLNKELTKKVLKDHREAIERIIIKNNAQ